MRYLTTILMTMVLISSSFGSWFSCSPEKTSLRELQLQAEITRNTAEFVMSFEIDISDDKKELELLVGDVACMDYKISDKKHQLTRTKTGYTLKFDRSGTKEVSIRFATKVTKSGESRVVNFKTPAVALRNLTLNYPEKFNVKVKGSLKKDVATTADQKSSLKTALPVGQDVEISWVPTAVTAHSQETAASAEVIAIADVNVDTILYNYLFKYKVIRNRLNNLSFDVPASVVVTDISGEGIRDWLVSTENGQQTLKVYLDTFPTDRYQLKLTAEQRIKAVPSDFKLSVVRPLGMMRTSGYLELGTYNGIKMAPVEQLGITRAAPNVGISHEKLAVRQLPRTLYMFSRVPFEMSLHTEFIKTVMAVDYQTLVSVDKDRVGVTALAEIEVRDNPAREFIFTVPTDYLVSQVNVVGHASDYRAEKVAGKQQLKVMLKQPVIGKVSLKLSLENDRLKGPVLTAPKVVLENAYSHRGVLIFQTALGLNCDISQTKGLRQVSLNSVSVRGQGLSSAWRYKVNDWEASFKVDQKPVSIYADSFHLYSLGESSTFGSTLINLHVAGAPIDRLKLKISPELKNVEFTGRAIRKSNNEDNTWTLELTDKIFGDYTLLVRYDTPLNMQTNKYKYQFIEVADAEHENGYMVLAGTEGIKIPEASYEGQIVELPVGELPSEYGVLVNSTVLKCYRYSRDKGESAALSFEAFRYKPTAMLSLIVDFTSALTQVSENGELVTTVTYRLKNASEQYFQLKMPEEAKLWSAKIEGKNIQLAQNDGALMVPLSKLRDPSKLINLQLIYAQKVNSLKDVSQFKLNLPLVKGQGTYAHWQVTVPDSYSFRSVNSNMELNGSDGNQLSRHNSGFINSLKYSFKSLVHDNHLQLLVIVTGLMLSFMTLALKLKKRYSKAIFSVVIFATVIVFTCFSQLSAIKVWLVGFRKVENVINLTKSVNLGGDVLMVNANVTEAMFYQFAPLFWGCLVATVVALILAIIKKNYLFGGIAMATFIVAANESNALSLIAALMTLCAAAWLAFVIVGFLLSLLIPRRLKTATAALLVLFSVSGSLQAKDLKEITQKKVTPEYTVDQADYNVKVVKGKSWAKVTCRLQWENPKNTKLPFTHAGAVIEKWTPSSLEIDELDKKNVISVDDDDSLDAVIEYLVPVVKKDDKYELALMPIPALRQQIVLQLPEDNYEINSTGVVQQKVSVVKKATTVTLTPMFKQSVKINWRQKIGSRNAKKADFMSELNTMVYLTEGVVYYDNQVNLQVVSGLLGQVEISLPVSQYPVSVKGADVSNWFYDQDKGQLKVGFKNKLNGHCKLFITTQQTTKAFPGTLEVQPMRFDQASQKRGRVNILADASVDFKVLEYKNGLKLESQPNFKIYKMATHLSSQARMNVKSFRFSNQQVELKVAVKPMKADIRVVESSVYNIEEERILYSSLFGVNVLKAGVYSLRIDIPTGFDVDRVDCAGVSHWDEFSENGKNYLMLFFKERLLGKSRVSTVISRINQEQTKYAVEAIEFAGATKHTGSLKVTSDSGTRLELVSKAGVAEVNLSKSRKLTSNELNFRILRGDRNVAIKVDRLKPWVELDKLSKISLRDKNCRVEEQLSFKVENAGIKSFTVVAPKNVGQLEFDGKNIVKIDHNKDEWKVTFDQRVFGYYNLKVRYQFGYDGAQAEFSPLVVKGTDLLRAYVSLTVKSTRLQVQFKDLAKSLKPVESMLLPVRWQNEVAEAVNCWQNIADDYQLQLQVQQYDSATGLPAEVNSVHIDTVVTEEGEQVSRVAVQIKSGSKRYLVVNLPKDQKLWRASVDGAFVTPLNEDGAVMIPLQQQIFSGDVAQKAVNIELVYAGEATKGWALENQVYEGPKFDLPLRNVTWSLYVPDGKYSKFDGTMKWLPLRSGYNRKWTMNALEQEVSQQMGSEEKKVKSLYQKGVNLANKGDNFAARQMYEQALNFGMSRELNEDLNVQLQDLQRSQAVVGLFKRRNEAFSNIAPVASEQRVQIKDNDWNRGSFNRELMTKVQKTLGRSETDIFNKISDKIISQQRSVNRRLRLINPSIPWSGKQLFFERQLQVSPNEEMKLSCSRQATYQTSRSSWSSLAIVAMIFIAIGAVAQYSKK